jgi:cellulose synthase/poly-beta-1,6-N-acetylglucosamine synthase-like glycosyltransferase
MSDISLIIVAIIYLVVLLLLTSYSANYLHLVWLARRYPPKPDQRRTLSQWPKVTVQLPIFNERFVVERLIDAAANLDYPRDQLQIQVLDDSTDQTSALAKAVVARYAALGLDIQHVHRTQRDGYKAGALRAGMDQASGEFFAIFDADFIPPRDFLEQTLPAFADRPKTAFVQTRWEHTNVDQSMLTQIQAISLDAHFSVDQVSRSGSDYWFNFNGTAGVWRGEAIRDAGGWTADTLTEDVDLSYRAFMKGWQAVYLEDVTVPAELPIYFSAYRQQQHRWARGSFECAVKLLPKIWRMPIALRKKVQATYHLSAHFVYVLLLILVFLYPVALLISVRFADYISGWALIPGIIMNFSALAPTLYLLSGQERRGHPALKKLPTIALMSYFLAGMMVNSAYALVLAVVGRQGIFKRTPKYQPEAEADSWLDDSYHLDFDPIVLIEIGLGLFSLGTVLAAVALTNWLIAFYASIFGLGFFITAIMTLAQELAYVRKRWARRRQVKLGSSEGIRG